MEIIKKIGDRYNAVERWALILMMVVLVSVIFAQVFSRYVLGTALYWSEELGKFVFVWLSWFGVSAGIHEKEHIQIKLFPDLLHSKGLFKSEAVTYIVIDLLWILTNVIVAYFGILIIQGQLQTGVYGASTRIPMWIAYLCVPLSAGLCSIRLIASMVGRAKVLFSGETETGKLGGVK